VKKTTAVLAALAIGAAAIGISIAPPAAADPSCQDIGATTVCAQGTVNAGDQSADNSVGADQSADNTVGLDPAPNSVAGPFADFYTGGCQTPYGTYQNCNSTG
jgi:hypothetical protein